MEERVVVVVEDDPAIGDLVGLYLRRAGFRALLAATGQRGLELADQHRPDLAVLDIGLPDVDGFEVCRRLRVRSPHLPVLFLTARGAETDRLAGFDLGADDYVVKPFSPPELVARVQAIIGRVDRHMPSAGPGPEVITLGSIEVDEARREVRVDGGAVALAMREFELLAFLARNRSLALTRRQLLDGAWGLDWEGDERTVDVHVGQLRRKLGAALPLATVWGVGYRLG
ncbi:MAG: response regulator transcription factor [Ilumatobacteraceae bacterium]